MSNLKLDENHDIIVTRSIARTDGLEYCAQLVKCRLLTFLGEWKLDPNIGIPWTGVLDRSYDISATKFAVQRTIETTPGVKSLNSLTLKADNETRLLTVDFTATSIYGEIAMGVTV
jgi:hypothetical protein